MCKDHNKKVLLSLGFKKSPYIDAGNFVYRDSGIDFFTDDLSFYVDNQFNIDGDIIDNFIKKTKDLKFPYRMVSNILSGFPGFTYNYFKVTMNGRGISLYLCLGSIFMLDFIGDPPRTLRIESFEDLRSAIHLKEAIKNVSSS